MTTTLNGWDTEAMQEAVAGVEEQPEAGKVSWRGRVCWDGGFGLDVKTSEIEQMGEVLPRHFTLRGDHPPELLGKNTGPTAIETLLAALGACMAGTFAAQATARGIAVESLEIDLAADIDLNGFFGLRPVAPGISDVHLAFRVRCDADRETLDELLEAARSHSPVFDSVSRPIPVELSVEAA
ncbi:MAG: OsmC family protein [Thermoanaerobaculia bacterium]